VFTFNCFGVGLKLALRSHFIKFLVFFVLVVLVFSGMAAQFSGRQPATVALDVGFSAIRLLVPLWIVFQVQDLLYREFERRLCLVSISYPVSRLGWLYSRVCVILFLVVVMQVFLFAALALEVNLIARWYSQATPVALGFHYWLAVLFQILDVAVLLGIAVFLSVSASTSSFIFLGTLGFMLVARSFADVLALLVRSPWVVGDVVVESYRDGLGVFFYLLPDLGGLDLRELALYGEWSFLPRNIFWVSLSALCYVGGAMVLAGVVLQRRKIN